MVIADEPWAAALVTYVLDSDPSQWYKRRVQVRRLRKVWSRAWEAQGRTEHFADLDLSGDWMNPWDRNQSVRVGCALDRALQGGIAPADLLPVAQMLLPDRYLETLGWANLTHLPEAVLSLLVTRSESEQGMNPRFRDLAYWLRGQRDPWLAATCGCIAAAMMGERNAHGEERNAPKTIADTVASLAHLLRSPEAPLLTEHTVRHFLINYTQGGNENVSCSMAATRVQNLKLYLVAAGAQGRLIENEPQLEARLAPWLLPPVSLTLDIDDLLRQAREEQRERRQRRLDALMPNILPLLTVNESRAAAFQALHAAAREAHSRFSEGAHQPLRYDVILPDCSATLSFRIATVRQLDEEARAAGIALPVRKTLLDDVLTEYVGACDASGTPLEQPFFADLHDAWYDAACRERFLEAGHRMHDFVDATYGVMKPKQGLNIRCQLHYTCARAAGRRPRILLDWSALTLGVAYGTLFFMLAFANAMRIHEIQQMRVDKNYSHRSEGRISFQVLPKNGKRAPGKAKIHQIPDRLHSHVIRLMTLHEERWPGWPVLKPYKADAMGYQGGKYLFSTGDTCLRQNSLRGFARHTSAGLEVHGMEDFFASHDLRYANALARLEKETPLPVIQAELGHHYQGTTLTYTFGQTIGTTHHLQPRGRHLTLWEALQAKRSADL
ncbi:hypothetical protein [Deinococcus aquaticus]|uniref:Tyr recombinase domain-containing protein n=1 Tax=Deinococcus aquaticus TaxID=328692 RepID=A0ABY7V7B6_9DEIO|nr:hypothetical protein [Deinococcus aquaticus]WDA60549.1 hypothetical protein M8445_17580 [Deinococcus aquaticus]